MKNILFLNLAVMPYHVVVFKALIEKGYNCVVYWYGTAPKTTYRAPKITGLTLVNRFDYKSASALFDDSKKYNPLVVVCSGWADKGYNKVCAKYRKAGIKTLASSDTQWRGGRQWLNRILSPLRHKRYFDYILAAGILQFDYARKLGFDSSQILLNFFSGDVNEFKKVSIEKKKTSYPKRFLFVGRFVQVKAIDVLLKAWNEIGFGDGPLKSGFKEHYPDVIYRDFMTQADLVKEAQNAGCFIISSRFEQWAFVIQEFAAAGMPIICTRQCGATRHFVLNGYNGYVVDSENVEALKNAMLKVISMPDDELVEFSECSRELGMSMTPEIAANTVLSVIK